LHAFEDRLEKQGKIALAHSTIVFSTVIFNMLATLTMAFFAICGVLAVACRKSSLNIFRGRMFIQTFCAAALIAFALEATVFNVPYYLKYFSDAEFHTLSLSPESDTAFIPTSDGSSAEFIYTYRSGVNPAEARSAPAKKDSVKILDGVIFKGLNKSVSSIFVQPIFDTAQQAANTMFVNIEYFDEESGGRFNQTLYKWYPQENYIVIQSCGKVSELKVRWNGNISQIAINKQVPLRFSGLRLFVVSCLLFAAIALLCKKRRAKIAYLLFEYKFDPADKKQNKIYALAVALLILFSGVCAFTSTSKFFREDYLPNQQYSRFLVDAIIDGRTYLDHGWPEMLLVAERPYDVKWLHNNGYLRDVHWMQDWVYYNGKLYCYFGVVPAVLLYVPYKMITGEYLSNNAGIFLFTAIAVLLMAILWRFLVKKYMPNTLFVFYLLSFLTLFFASGLFATLRFTRFYSIVSAAGFMFVIAGVLLLLKSVEHKKLNLLQVFSACLCLALAVGCRPSMVFVSLLVPVVLWKYRSWRSALIIMVPYIMVAIPLCMYNYARFDSIFDFGFKYNMTTLNTGAYALLSLPARLLNTFVSALSYLVAVNEYSLFYPFIESVARHTRFPGATVVFFDKGSGMINFPIVFCLFFFFKEIFAKGRPKTFYLSSAFLAIAAVMILLNSWLVGLSGRYVIDFAFFMLVPSIFCAWRWCGGDDSQDRLRLKIVYAMLGVSILVGLFLFAGEISNDPSPGNPVLYRYLQTSLGIPGTY